MQISRSNVYLLVGILVVSIITIFPFFYYQEDITLRVHDNMDSNIVWVKMLLDNNACWVAPDTIIEQIMNGVPRSSLLSTYDLALLVFWIFGIFWGYAINKVFLAIIAFAGMYLLLKKHILSDNTPIYISVLTAILFAILPFWSFIASVAGVPLVFWAFLNLRNNDKRVVNWLALILYAFYSSLVLTGLFVLIALSCVFAYDLIINRKFGKYLFAGLALTSFAYILSHWPMFYMHLFDSSGYVSHRAEMKVLGNIFLGFYAYFWDALKNGGPSHLISMQAPIILVLACVIPVLMVITGKYDKKFLFVLAVLLLSTLTISLLGYEKIRNIVQVIYDNTIALDMARVHWLTPALWYVLLGLAFAYVTKYIPKGTYIVIVLFCLQFYNIQRDDTNLLKDSNSKLTYKEFYSTDQYNEIKEVIGSKQSDYRVISVGVVPAVAQFNGFYTLDGYLADYPLEYKHRFGEVIHDELEQCPFVKWLFTTWGNYCYAYSCELWGQPDPKQLPEVKLDYNFEALKKIAIEKDVYIISATRIKDTPIELIQELKSQDWHWNVYLYKVN
ncbi:DUF6044 family protein [Dysgonomonas massiliensis]|uniref:DUF6044 family protein n=1 Tax=Dysgonomonas massiliensis TaxID=2040292 RepID=UPI000C758CFE|nr:DUF6044 family protein [Dysgonomonas massiliensis]